MSGWLSIGEAAGLVLLGIISVATQRLTRRTHKAVEPNGETLSAILHEIKQTGETTRELLREDIEQGAYMHTRNHDLLNAVTKVDARIQLQDQDMRDRDKRDEAMLDLLRRIAVGMGA